MLKITPIREYFNSILKSMLKKIAKDDQTKWDPYRVQGNMETVNYEIEMVKKS